jgi:biopolymer transport protein ExbB
LRIILILNLIFAYIPTFVRERFYFKSMPEPTDFHPIHLFLKGGVFMWPLLFCSILGLAVILDRALVFLFLGRSTPVLQSLRESLVCKGRLLHGGDLPTAILRSRHPVAAIARVYLRNLQRPAALRLELVKAEGSAQLERVEKRLRILATISHLSPLLGLLGTVTGLVIAFASMQSLGAAAKPSDLAGGIWEALLTTVFGLIVAIPCMAAYHGFEGAADKLSREMQSAVVLMDDLLEAAHALEEPDRDLSFGHSERSEDFTTVA